ncbi:uncharacterized protein [Argopecten irradians]|uniref:uncharacterized protein n=1 Tax=Argopecten irradians TaxID=31199 RepID=UPI00371B1BEF
MTWYCSQCQRFDKTLVQPTSPTPQLTETPVTPYLSETPTMPTLSTISVTPQLTQTPAMPTLSTISVTPQLTHTPAMSTLSTRTVTPQLTQTPAMPTLSIRTVTPQLTQAPAMPTLSTRTATPQLTQTRAMSTLSARSASSILNPWPATPTVAVSPVTPTLERIAVSASNSPVRKRLVMTDSSSSSDEYSDSDETDFKPFSILRSIRRFPCRDRQTSPAADATFIIERHRSYTLDDQSPRQMDKAFLVDDSDEDTWTPNMRTDIYSDDSDEEADDETRYQILENSTNRGQRKLVSSDGYSYTVKKASTRTTTWKCSVRNKLLVQCIVQC